MTPSSSTISDLRELLDALRSENAAVQEEYDALRLKYENSIRARQQEIEGVERTIDLLANRSLGSIATNHVSTDGKLHRSNARQEVTTSSLSLTDWRQKLRGRTHLQALIRIAEENQGIVRVTEAKRIFVAAKVSEGKAKNIPSQIYRLLTQSDQFEKVEPGVFRLINATAPEREPASGSSQIREATETRALSPYQDRFPAPIGPQLLDQAVSGVEQQDEM